MEFILNHKLINLLKYYNDNTMVADHDFVMEAVKILTKSWQIGHLVSNVTISNAQFPSFMDSAKYSYENKDFTLFLSGDEKVNDGWQILLNNKDRMNTYNLFVLRLILREFYKVKQLIEAKSTDTVKGILLRESLEDILKTRSDSSDEYKIYLRNIAFNREKSKNHDIMPCNRLANVDAILKVMELYPHLYYANPDLVDDYYTYIFSRVILLGYDHYISPTLKFIVLQNYLARNNFDPRTVEESLKEMAKENNESDNLYLGLPITSETYNRFMQSAKSTETYKLIHKK